jgi:hypothetical protein
MRAVCRDPKGSAGMKVVLRSPSAPDGTEYRSLTPGRVYEVLGIEGDWFRLLDDTDDPILFDPVCFEVTDPVEPEYWVTVRGEEGERYAYPAEWGDAGFFEDYHDNLPRARETFWSGLRRYYPDTARERRTGVD